MACARPPGPHQGADQPEHQIVSARQIVPQRQVQNAHTRARLDLVRSNPKHDVMLRGDGVKIRARADAEGLRNGRERTRSYHRLLDLVVDGHHAGAGGAGREEKTTCR